MKYNKFFISFFLPIFFFGCEHDKTTQLGDEIFIPQYCKPIIDPLKISHKSIIGVWELYEIIDTAKDTIYYPPCDPNREHMQTIEFTDELLRIDTAANKEIYSSEVRIGGYPKLTSYYSLLSNDSLEFHCVTRLLGGQSEIANEFLDFCSTYLCQPGPCKLNFSDYFLSLIYSSGVTLKYIVVEN